MKGGKDARVKCISYDAHSGTFVHFNILVIWDCLCACVCVCHTQRTVYRLGASRDPQGPLVYSHSNYCKASQISMQVCVCVCLSTCSRKLETHTFTATPPTNIYLMISVSFHVGVPMKTYLIKAASSARADDWGFLTPDASPSVSTFKKCRSWNKSLPEVLAMKRSNETRWLPCGIKELFITEKERERAISPLKITRRNPGEKTKGCN